MAATHPKNGRPADPPWRLLTTGRKYCWFCKMPDPGGTEPLGADPDGTGGSPIDVCARGTGCRDGRIHHGVNAPAHHPGEACTLCAKEPPWRDTSRDTTVGARSCRTRKRSA